LKPGAAPAGECGALHEIELPHQAIAASRAWGVPALGEADLDFVEDQPLLGLGGFASEVQNEQPGPVGFDRVQVEVNPAFGNNAPSAAPLKRSTGRREAEDFLPSPVQQVEAMGLFDQSPAAMSPPSSASATTHERFPS
jgi:hypothetical protein